MRLECRLATAGYLLELQYLAHLREGLPNGKGRRRYGDLLFHLDDSPRLVDEDVARETIHDRLDFIQGHAVLGFP